MVMVIHNYGLFLFQKEAMEIRIVLKDKFFHVVDYEVQFLCYRDPWQSWDSLSQSI